MLNSEHTYADLGLPSHTLWATCNVGATKPEESGDYFMWGETEPKMQPHPNAKLKSIPNAIEEYPGKDFLKFKSEHDAATTNWGEPWFTPTSDDFIELEECCQWTWIMQDEVYGYKVTGPNGNYIFLPATGEYRYKDLLNVGKRGGYWTCSPTHMPYTHAVVFQFDSESTKCDTSLIEIRYTVRPIRIRK